MSVTSHVISGRPHTAPLINLYMQYDCVPANEKCTKTLYEITGSKGAARVGALWYVVGTRIQK